MKTGTITFNHLVKRREELETEYALHIGIETRVEIGMRNLKLAAEQYKRKMITKQTYNEKRDVIEAFMFDTKKYLILKNR